MPMSERECEDRLETWLRACAAVPPASPDLASRIIHAARLSSRTSEATFAAWLADLLAAVLPRPAFALAAVLTLGIALGFAAPNPIAKGGDIMVQDWFADDGAAL